VSPGQTGRAALRGWEMSRRVIGSLGRSGVQAAA
jgi:hypothetical protein